MFGASNQLVATVQRLEEGEIDLEEALRLYEQGMLLAQHCSDLLDQAELQVEEVTTVSSQEWVDTPAEEG